MHMFPWSLALVHSVVPSLSSLHPPFRHLPHPHLPHPHVPHLHPNPKDCPSSDSTRFCLMWTSALGSRRMLVLMLLSYQWRTGEFPGKELPTHNLSLTDVSGGVLSIRPPHRLTTSQIHTACDQLVPSCRHVYVYCTLLSLFTFRCTCCICCTVCTVCHNCSSEYTVSCSFHHCPSSSLLPEHYSQTSFRYKCADSEVVREERRARGRGRHDSAFLRLMY